MEVTSDMKDEKSIVVETLWLRYFNQYLFEHGVITEEMRNSVKIKIDSRLNASKKDV